MDVNAILSGVTIGTITFGGIIRAVFLTLVGMIVIRILLNIVDKALERSKNLTDLRVYIRSVVKILLWFIIPVRKQQTTVEQYPFQGRICLAFCRKQIYRI